MTEMVEYSTPALRPAQIGAHEIEIQRATMAANGAMGGAWGEFLRKVLPPIAPQPTLRLVRIARA